MSVLVIDGSVVVNWFLQDEPAQSAYAQKVRLKIPQVQTLSVPPHWMLEVVNALLVAERRKRIPAAAVDHALGVLRQIPVRYDSDSSSAVITQTLELARQNMLSIYDAAYLELALRLGASLATLDEPLKAAAKRRGVKII